MEEGGLDNPKGVEQNSPGLQPRQRRYPGFEVRSVINPEGVEYT